MPTIRAEIRKASEGGGTPWVYAYEEDGSLETVVVGFATANAALNAVRDRIINESFAGQIVKIAIVAVTPTVA